MSGTWPDGLPVHGLTLYVRLSCGHERVARGWRGSEGETYCCDACHQLATIEEVSLTDQAPYAWRPATGDDTLTFQRGGALDDDLTFIAEDDGTISSSIWADGEGSVSWSLTGEEARRLRDWLTRRLGPR